MNLMSWSFDIKILEVAQKLRKVSCRKTRGINIMSTVLALD